MINYGESIIVVNIHNFSLIINWSMEIKKSYLLKE